MKAAEQIKAVSFVAKSGTGKTTLLEKLIIELRSRGYRVGAFKGEIIDRFRHKCKIPPTATKTCRGS